MFPKLHFRNRYLTMVRFSVTGDDDGNEDRPRNNNRPSPKRLRISRPLVATASRAAAAAAAAAPSPSNLAAAGGARRPEEPIAVQSGSEEQSSDGSENSLSHISSESEDDSEEEEEEEEEQNLGSGNEVQPTEGRVDPKSNGNGPCRELEGVSVTLKDPDVLDCPICFEPLCSPVYQCENGHIACASCCTKLKNKCGSCCWPIGYNRCRAMEKVLDSVRIACRNMPYGCLETLSYSKKQDHEKTCDHVPCTCPFVGCDYADTSKSVYSHFAQMHPHSSRMFLFNSLSIILLDNTQKKVFLQDSGKSTLFILHRSVEAAGASFVNVACIGPTSERREEPFLYELTAVAGESSIKLRTFVKSVPNWKAESPKKICLIVPRDFTGKNELRLELIIRRNLAVPR